MHCRLEGANVKAPGVDAILLKMSYLTPFGLSFLVCKMGMISSQLPLGCCWGLNEQDLAQSKRSMFTVIIQPPPGLFSSFHVLLAPDI